MIEQKNYGVKEERRDTDWVAGGVSGIVYQERLSNGDWTIYLPSKEYQVKTYFETYACVTFSAMNLIETQIDFLAANNLIPETQLQQLKDWGFFDEYGKFNCSDEYIAVLSKTGYKDGNYGNSGFRVWDAICTYGVIPQKSLDRSGVKTADEWYAPIPQELIDLGKSVLKVLKFNYEWVKTGTCSALDVAKTQYHLKQAPLQMLAHCAESEKDGILSNTNCECQHATEIYAIDTNVYQFDTYGEFYNKLSGDYVIPYVLKGLVTINTSIEEQKKTILLKIIELYKQIINMYLAKQNKAGTNKMTIQNIFYKYVWCKAALAAILVYLVLQFSDWSTIIYAIATYFGITLSVPVITGAKKIAGAFKK